MSRVCDQCQPTIDGYLDLWAVARRQRDNAQGCAWKATDLLTRWMDLFIEREHMTDNDYIAGLAQLLSESQGFILTAPAYTLASSALSSIGDSEAATDMGSSRGTVPDGISSLAGRRHLPRSTSGDGGVA